MSLSSLQLDAFFEVAKNRSFSKAAKFLGLTQSALSQRVSHLEQDLGSSLFLRETSGIRLTELGEKLFRMCQLKGSIEDEFLTPLRAGNQNDLAGIIKIGGFSTVMRSILLPIFAEFSRKNPNVQFEFLTRELGQLPGLLLSGEADFILNTKTIESHNMENIQLGTEENVLVQAKNGKSKKDVYLDHDAEDSTTEDFFKIQLGKTPKFRKQYMDEVYSIIDGVLLGYGRSVLPVHIVKEIRGLEILSNYRPLKVPVYLSYYRQPYYTKLQTHVLALFQEKVPERLNP